MIVLVDDIDRLLPAEMVDVFRLVRSVGDFPNVYYVLAFDHEVVTKALTSECGTDGARYLEKIIQVPFDLPRPDLATLHGLFTRRLDELLSDVEAPLFDMRYWSDVFTNGIAPFLGTPRDVVRLLNPLAVLYPCVRGEVNVVDFVAIEALRVFVPEAYKIVRSAQASFVGFPVIVDHLKEGNRLFHEGWLGQLKENQQAVREIIVRLFPAVGSLLKPRGGVPKDAVLRKARRIASEHFSTRISATRLAKASSVRVLCVPRASLDDELGATL